jgi:quaternary ammonium compound-resistance protein SugE
MLLKVVMRMGGFADMEPAHQHGRDKQGMQDAAHASSLAIPSGIANPALSAYLAPREATSSPFMGQVRDGPAAWKQGHVVAWIILIIAGLLEIVWAFSMKRSDGFTRLMPSLVTIGAMIISFALLSWSMRTLPLGTAYTVWTGIGAVGAFVVGIAILGEAANPMRVAAAGLIVGGLVLMKLSSTA